MNKPTKTDLIHEGKEMLAIFLYLALFFCTFTAYRRLVMHEVGLSYFHYGSALVKALVLSKVILLGQHVRFSRMFDDRPLAVTTLYKVVLFSLFYMAFEILEHVVGTLLHGKPVIDAFREIAGVGKAELLARALVILFAFLPFFAFSETGRVLGKSRLFEMFFGKRAAKPDQGI